jgi:type VI secretion system protein ImpB
MPGGVQVVASACTSRSSALPDLLDRLSKSNSSEDVMSDSLQKWVGRNRPPRVQITYDVEVGGAIEKKELPLVVGLMADLSGQPLQPLPKLKARRLVDIDRDNFNDVMEKIAPRLDLSVPDTYKKDGNLKIELNFKHINDFHPEAIVKQVKRLDTLLVARQQLRDLLGKLDGNDELDALLENIVQNTEELKSLKSKDAAGASAEPAAKAASAPSAEPAAQSAEPAADGAEPAAS